MTGTGGGIRAAARAAADTRYRSRHAIPYNDSLSLSLSLSLCMCARVEGKPQKDIAEMTPASVPQKDIFTEAG